MFVRTLLLILSAATCASSFHSGLTTLQTPLLEPCQEALMCRDLKNVLQTWRSRSVTKLLGSTSDTNDCLDHLVDPSRLPAAAQLRRTSFPKHSHDDKNGCIVLVDVENVRGKSGFGMSHTELLRAMTVWSRIFPGHVSLVVDHGSEASAYHLPGPEHLAIVFSGPSRKADDVIAHDVTYLMDHSQSTQPKGEEDSRQRNVDRIGKNRVVVVTADRGLIDRCRRSATSRPFLTILSPLILLQDLDYILTTLPIETEASFAQQQLPQPFLSTDVADAENGRDLQQKENTNNHADMEPQIKVLEHEIKLGAELLEAEALLRNKSGVNNKRRGKLKAKVWKLREKLNQQGSLLDQVVSNVLRQGPQKALSGNVLSTSQQSALLSRWQKVRSKSQRKECTGDRVILAEQWRRQLHERFGAISHRVSSGTGDLAMAHAQKYAITPQEQLAKNLDHSDTLRLVVLSDTHGFEASLTEEAPLPTGDVLLHLGDFAMDGTKAKRESVERFDHWLAEHGSDFAHIIVVRGNHDPKIWYPAKSGATFVTKPTTITIGNFLFAIVPFMSGGAVSNRLMPRRCHVLCTHIPPYQLLDRSCTGKHAGSSSLRKGMERMATKSQHPPALWLCGHIHEGRGAVRHAFGGNGPKTNVVARNNNQQETLVLNAANANLGIAKRMEHGPVVLELTLDKTRSGGKRSKARAEIISMDRKYEYLNNKDKSSGFFEPTATNGETTNEGADVTSLVELLLAVDLGLRTGFSLFNDRGMLLAYTNENLVFETKRELIDGAINQMKQWESMFSQEKTCRITRIAVEGSDVELRDAWEDIADATGTDLRRCPQILWVRPEEWRADLLVGKEKLSGVKAKEAARLIARQVVADFSGRLHGGKFQTDVAESVLLGYHVSRRLGWIQREPAVRRYSNGNVVVPTDAKVASIISMQEEKQTAEVCTS